MIQLNGHFLRVVDEVGAEVTAVELHPLDDVEFVVDPFGFFDGNDAITPYFIHRFGDHGTDTIVRVGGDRRDLCDLFFVVDDA